MQYVDLFLSLWNFFVRHKPHYYFNVFFLGHIASCKVFCIFFCGPKSLLSPVCANIGGVGCLMTWASLMVCCLEEFAHNGEIFVYKEERGIETRRVESP